jgi:hypothetical protein
LGIVHHELVIALAARHKLPAVFPTRVYVADGGLISYVFKAARNIALVSAAPVPRKPSRAGRLCPLAALDHENATRRSKTANTMGIVEVAALAANADASGLPRNLSPSAPAGIRASRPPGHQAIWGLEIRSPASPGDAPAPRAAMQPPLRRVSLGGAGKRRFSLIARVLTISRGYYRLWRMRNIACNSASSGIPAH